MSKKFNLINGLWYAVENLSSIAFSLVSVFFVARYFGPENLGKLSLVQAASSVFLCLATLGLDHFIVRDLARNRNDTTLLGSVMLAQLIGWIAYTFLVLSTLWLMGKLSSNVQMLVIALCVILTTLFTRATIGKLYFQATNEPKVIAKSALASRITALVYIVYVLSVDLPYELVLLYLPIQAAIQWLMLFYSYQNSSSGVMSWRFDSGVLKKSLHEAFPVLLSAAIFPIFMQADILIISHLMSDRDAGIYSAAMRIITQFVFVGHIATMTFYAALSASLARPEIFERILSGLIKILFLVSFSMALFGFLYSDLIINILYGSRFSDSADVLKILVWVWPFIIPAALYSRLLILRGHAKYELIKSLIAASISLTLNFTLIPYWGLSAAATASVISYFFADFAIYAFFKETRKVNKLAIKAILDIFTRPIQSYASIMYTLASKP